MKAQRGQVIVPVALFLMFIAVIIIGISMVLTESPTAQEFKDKTMDALQAVGSDGQETNTHPLEQHGVETVEEINSCIDNGGVIKELQNSETGRTAKICFIDSCKRYGAKIEECNGDLVTLFKKDKLKTLDQVLKYFLNRGYTEH